MVDEEDLNTVVETVDVNDDDDAPVEDENYDAAEAAMENTREKAEARRKRILEKANKRMDYVNGEQIQNNEEKKTSLSNAARIRAARQRRYGKKSASVATTTTAKTTKTTTENITEAADTTTNEQPDSKIMGPTLNDTETESTIDETKKEESDGEVTQFDEPVGKLAGGPETSGDELIVPTTETKKAEGPETSGDEAIAPTTEKKKVYLGVARMRRQMLAKKRNDKADSATETVNSTSNEKTAEGTVTDSVGKVRLPSAKVQTIPIYMHIFVIVLLFVAGFDVGIQQFHADVDVRFQVAFQEFGIPIVQRNPLQSLTKITSIKNAKRALVDELRQQTDGEKKSSSDLHDEFLEINLVDEEYVPNIDPLFGVDLDEITEGPGVLNKLAKGAITMHRIILWLIYYAPISIFNSIISIPSSLIQTPPTLFLSAIILRQVLGKMILGAVIPDAGDDTSDGKKQNKIEVLSMAKNFVKNFFVASFPTLVTLYDVFVHLKSDMYIVLCGVFLGLAWTHLSNICDAPIVISEETVRGSTDEL